MSSVVAAFWGVADDDGLGWVGTGDGIPCVFHAFIDGFAYLWGNARVSRLRTEY